MDLKSFTQTIRQIVEEKGIAEARIFETIEMALAAAYKRDYGKRGQVIRAELNPQTGGVKMFQVKLVVDETMIKSEEEIAQEDSERESANEHMPRRDDSFSPRGGRADADRDDEGDETLEAKKIRFNAEKHLMLEEARAIKPDAQPGDQIEFALPDHGEFGRIAAQTAKQVIIQRIREAEREAIYTEYKEKEGQLISGLVQRIEGRNVFMDIGKAVGVLPPEEQIPRERYQIGERLKVLIVLVERNMRSSGVFLSRSHPRMLKKLFEIEVPEIAAGTVEIRAIAREPGARSKVAVVSHEPGVDPVGSLVGQKGVRVSTVIQELGGEKIDVIEWSDDPARFIAHALSPAKATKVVLFEQRKEAQATVPDDQLSLAIGKTGQNVRLAAKLTGWKIEVRSDQPPAPMPAAGQLPATQDASAPITEPQEAPAQEDPIPATPKTPEQKISEEELPPQSIAQPGLDQESSPPTDEQTKLAEQQPTATHEPSALTNDQTP